MQHGREAGAEDDDQGHRRARRRLEGRRLVRPQRPARRLGRDARRGSSRSPTSSVGTRTARRALFPARGRMRVASSSRGRRRTIALEPFFMEFIAGVEGRALATLDRPHAAARPVRRGGGRGLPALVRRASGRRGLRRRRAPRRSPRRGAHDDGAAGGRDRRAAPGRRRSPRSGTTRPPSWSRPCAIWPRSATAGSRGWPAWRTSSTRRSGRGHSASRPSSSGSRREVVATDYTPESGARATRRLLSSPEPPTAIIFDSDLLAVTGLGVAQQMGFTVPDDVSLIGWDDSLISRVVHPPLTAITRDIEAYGATAAAPPARGDRGHDDAGTWRSRAAS